MSRELRAPNSKPIGSPFFSIVTHFFRPFSTNLRIWLILACRSGFVCLHFYFVAVSSRAAIMAAKFDEMAER